MRCASSRPMRSFLPWLHGRLQFLFPASKFRVLLNIWFVLVDSENLIAFGGNSWCPYYNHFYYVSVHLLFSAVQAAMKTIIRRLIAETLQYLQHHWQSISINIEPTHAPPAFPEYRRKWHFLRFPSIPHGKPNIRITVF